MDTYMVGPACSLKWHSWPKPESVLDLDRIVLGRVVATTSACGGRSLLDSTTRRSQQHIQSCLRAGLDARMCLALEDAYGHRSASQHRRRQSWVRWLERMRWTNAWLRVDVIRIWAMPHWQCTVRRTQGWLCQTAEPHLHQQFRLMRLSLPKTHLA